MKASRLFSCLTPKKNLVNLANLVIILVLVFSSCVFYPIDDPTLGTISFTATHDCDIRLFDSDSTQVARVSYEVGKSPAIVHMKSSGEFIVLAEFVGAGLAPAQKIKKEPITYVSGNVDYYIEF